MSEDYKYFFKVCAFVNVFRLVLFVIRFSRLSLAEIQALGLNFISVLILYLSLPGNLIFCYVILAMSS